MTYAVDCGYGHRIIDDDKVMYTSTDAIVADLDSLCKMLNTAAKMLSELIDVKREYIIEDLYELTGCDIWEEAIKAVLANKGVKPLPTLTEDAFYEAMKNKWTVMEGEM